LVQGASDTDSFNVTATYALDGVADFGLFFTNWEEQTSGYATNEIALTVGKSIGNLDVTLAYINTDADSNNNLAAADKNAENNIQAYFTYNF